MLNQESARQNYKLMAMARLFEGAQLPKFEVPTIGSRMGTDKDENLVATPADALTQYADVLQNGANSKFASQFADDQLRQKIARTDQSKKYSLSGMVGKKSTGLEGMEHIFYNV